MLHKAIQQLFTDVGWGELDYLIVDLPPGTGDGVEIIDHGTFITIGPADRRSLDDGLPGLIFWSSAQTPCIRLLTG